MKYKFGFIIAILLYLFICCNTTSNTKNQYFLPVDSLLNKKFIGNENLKSIIKSKSVLFAKALDTLQFREMIIIERPESGFKSNVGLIYFPENGNQYSYWQKDEVVKMKSGNEFDSLSNFNRILRYIKADPLIKLDSLEKNPSKFRHATAYHSYYLNYINKSYHFFFLR